MKTKPRDIQKCGIDRYILNSLDINIPYEKAKLFRDFIYDRYMIHLSKDYYNKNDLYSFIEDDELRSIFKKYKFCNVRREQDRCSKWLIDHISNSNENLDKKIYRSILFRIYNNIQTAELINIDSCPLFSDEGYNDYLEDCKAKMQPKSNSYYKYFTNAYSTTGMKSAINKRYPDLPLPVTPIQMVRDLYNNGNYSKTLLESKTQLDVYYALKMLVGISYFMAYQLYVDLTYIPEFPFSENEFVIAGPGCKYGLDELGIDTKHSEEAVFWLRDNLLDVFKSYNIDIDLEKLMIDLPESDRCLNVMMIENCLCEFQKLCRAMNKDLSNPRVLYKPFDIKTG